MSFQLCAGTSIEQEVQRVAREQIDSAIAEVNDPALDRHEAVHDVRKRCKKLRGLIRLVRPQFEDTYNLENAWYRDSARRLSYVRDAQSMIETLDALNEHFRNQLDDGTFHSVRRQLSARRRQVADDEVGLAERLQEFLERIQAGRDRIAGWRLGDKGFSAVEGGLIKTYRRGRAAMKKAYKNPSAETFHEWRKRVKYHWYHLRLLRPIWPGPMQARIDEADALADSLGDDHDLSILRDALTQRPDEFGGERTVQALAGLIAQRQIELRLVAKALGTRLFAEKPAPLARRIGIYWQAWQSEHGAEPQTAQAPKLMSA